MQLAQLSDVINRFKSEQVQLKIVELVFRGVGWIWSSPTPSRILYLRPENEHAEARQKVPPPNRQLARTIAKPRLGISRTTSYPARLDV